MSEKQFLFIAENGLVSIVEKATPSSGRGALPCTSIIPHRRRIFGPLHYALEYQPRTRDLELCLRYGMLLECECRARPENGPTWLLWNATQNDPRFRTSTL